MRPKLVTVRGLDLDGNEVVIEGDELMGRLIQHEIDHLDGVLLLDRLEPDARKEAMRELRRHRLPDAARADDGGVPPALTPAATLAADARAHRLPRHPSRRGAGVRARSSTPATTSRSSSPNPTGAGAAGARRCRAR